MGRLRIWMLVAVVVAMLLMVFLIVDLAGVPLVTDPRPVLGTVSVAAAAIGVGLLVADAVLPVPSSVVMVALGATFGLAAGAALALLGGLGGFAVGYVLGWRSRKLLVTGTTRPAGLVRRWGLLAVVVSRPLPLVAETVAYTAGALGMRPVATFAAAAAGTAGPAVAFSYAGWRGATAGDGFVVFGAVAVATLLCWVLGRSLMD
ncbi:VTT domain-containing protein [Actinoplanes aureus]|uniref:VTT domain-containing protein n=1 Tax=Actinoplanes aureus TaxID=2792083 RepID=A0A931CIR5_9ACTN|nr:VTT domain-containing protein [Actinoplanes aureus]MBG0568417.1 VTT domain-containing protein [Actinoplanes aureus]